MIKTRNVSKEFYKNYLKKAEEYFSAMNTEFEKRNFNSCVLNAIHCGISSADSLTVFFKGVRHCGERHEDVLSLLNSLEIDKNELRNKTRQLVSLIDIKNAIEYEEKLTTENGALISIKNAERFLSWVQRLLKS